MRRTGGLFLLSLAIIAMAGCGGKTGNVTFSSGSTTAMQVSVSDAPADQLLSLQLTINSIVLTTASNATVGVLPAATTVEISHLQATAQPISQVTVRQDTYTQATVNISNVAATYVNLSGQTAQANFSGTFNLPISLIPNLVVGQNPLALNFDLNLAQSLQSLGVTNDFVPVMTATINNVPALNQQEEDTGGVHDLTGVVNSTGASSFVLAVGQVSTLLTIAVDGNTQFVGVSALGGLAASNIVEVNAALQGNNTLLASKVEAEVGVKQEAEGIVVSRTAGSPNIFQIAVQSSAGTGAPSLGTLQTVSADNATTFVLPSHEANLSGLPFTPAFSSFANLAVGQRVDVRTTSTFGSVVSEVKLGLQTLRGLPTSQNGNQYTLTLPVDSAFHLLTGATSIDFIVQSNTELKGLTTIVLGTPVHVRGLLLFDAPSGRYKLVATRITP